MSECACEEVWESLVRPWGSSPFEYGALISFKFYFLFFFPNIFSQNFQIPNITLKFCIFLHTLKNYHRKIILL
ncbi:unnamed protein product, partial [Vitis vinifera]|uniref:Uncharacterized protein n=1 Tax=Vitis vinifera TaxID=29760 RepID=D7T3R1_VITVI